MSMDPIKARWQNLLKKDMSRKEFLGFLGLTAIAVLNAEALIDLFTKGSGGHTAVSSGYSSDSYSGRIDPRPVPGTKARGFDN